MALLVLYLVENTFVGTTARDGAEKGNGGAPTISLLIGHFFGSERGSDVLRDGALAGRVSRVWRDPVGPLDSSGLLGKQSAESVTEPDYRVDFHIEPDKTGLHCGTSGQGIREELVVHAVHFSEVIHAA